LLAHLAAVWAKLQTADTNEPQTVLNGPNAKPNPNHIRNPMSIRNPIRS